MAIYELTVKILTPAFDSVTVTSANILTRHHSHASSVPPIYVFQSCCTCRSICGPQSNPWGLCGPSAKQLEPPIGPTASHLAPDRWIWFSTTQHWFGNGLLVNAESSSLEHTRRNNSVEHRTSHTMMMIMISLQGTIFRWFGDVFSWFLHWTSWMSAIFVLPV